MDMLIMSILMGVTVGILMRRIGARGFALVIP